MQHSLNGIRGGFTGVGALMDPGFLREATHPQYPSDSEPGSAIGAWVASAVLHATGWLKAWLHRAG